MYRIYTQVDQGWQLVNEQPDFDINTFEAQPGTQVEYTSADGVTTIILSVPLPEPEPEPEP